MKQILLKNRTSILFLLLAVVNTALHAQGVTGINSATSELTKYIDPLATFVLVIGAVVGIVGAIRIYTKWNSGDPDINKAVMSYVASMIFLVLAPIIVKAFFGA